MSTHSLKKQYSVTEIKRRNKHFRCVRKRLFFAIDEEGTLAETCMYAHAQYGTRRFT